MKQLTCEMCGGVDLVKNEGLFVCQNCGTKYTVEEAKKMMIEGTVDVQGTVKVDNSAFVEKYLANARRAKQKEDWDEVEKYYNMVEQNEPTNIEAIFYSAYGKAKISLTDSDIYKRQATFKVLQNCISIIDDNFNFEKEEENKAIIQQISDDIIGMASSSYVYNQKKNGNGVVISDDKAQTITLFNNLHSEFGQSLNNIIDKYPAERKKETDYLYFLILRHYNFMINNGSLLNPDIWYDRIEEVHKKWHSDNPAHIIPQIERTVKKKGCYVATAVYGSYDCPEVWTLRRFRDFTLAETWYGRAFIRTYYAISPTLVAWFGHTEWFKKMWKCKLDRMVKNLQENGVEDTPYEDKNW
ncbi:MAG: TFIIB-type zinc finger domain-containing protein [Clostridia bacterium]|nr:TFIIB-type zinc finger domain-containing protein [Clostridia bacterium]